MKKLFVVIAAMAIVPVPALERGFVHPWEIEQLTSCMGGVSYNPRVSADGGTAFFISNCDLTGQNMYRSPQIFQWKDGAITQVTSIEYCSIGEMDLSPDTKRLVFSTTCEFGEENRERGAEIAVMELGGPVRVITRGGGHPSGRPSWSSDGRRIVFQSLADLAGKNPDHSQEIFMADLPGEEPEIRQMTDTRRNHSCQDPVMAASIILCRCAADMVGTRPPEKSFELPVMVDGVSVGGNPDLNFEIYSITMEGKVRQLTYTTGCENGPPALHPRGRAAAFMSNCRIEKDKIELKPSLYFYSEKVVRAFPDLYFDATSLTWSGDGRFLVMSSNFYSEATIPRVNPERNREIFMVRVPVDELAGAGDRIEMPDPHPLAVTDFRLAGSEMPDVNGEGTVVFFVSHESRQNSNPDGNPEIFRAVLARPQDFGAGTGASDGSSAP